MSKYIAYKGSRGVGKRYMMELLYERLKYETSKFKRKKVETERRNTES